MFSLIIVAAMAVNDEVDDIVFCSNTPDPYECLMDRDYRLSPCEFEWLMNGYAKFGEGWDPGYEDEGLEEYCPEED